MDAIADFDNKHDHRFLDPSDMALHLNCRPGIDTLANAFDPRPNKRFPSRRMVDDILVRWSGLRPLIDICFAFDGRWPSDSFAKNPMIELADRARLSSIFGPCSRGPSPRWIARLYKAILGAWFHQETINLCNIMHWENATALCAIRRLRAMSYPGASLRDTTDVMKAWGMMFNRLAFPPFQLGNPAIMNPSLFNRSGVLGSRNIFRPSDISDLLILSTDASKPFPPSSHRYLILRGATDVNPSTFIHISRHSEEDSPSEYGRRLYNNIHPAYVGLIAQVGSLFHLVGAGHRQPHCCHRTLRFWPRSLDGFVWDWAEKLQSQSDPFARYETNDQIIKDIVGTAILGELLPRDLNPQSSFPSFAEADWHALLAAGLRATVQRSCPHIIDLARFDRAMWDSIGDAEKTRGSPGALTAAYCIAHTSLGMAIPDQNDGA